jgi:hypothetical protein
MVLAPFCSAGTLPAVALVGGLNSAAFVCFYDTIREALTSAILWDTPIVSGMCGALSGAN